MYYIKPDQVVELTAATAYPVTLAEAKAHLRVDISDDDTLITNLIAAATAWVEQYTGRSYVERTLRADIPCFYDQMALPNRPVISITNIKYYNLDSPSILTTLDSNTYNLVQDVVYRSFGQTWEDSYSRMDSVQITYQAGYLSTASPKDIDAPVPQPVKQAMLLIIGDAYEQREGSIVGTIHTDNPAVTMLLQPYRVLV